MGQVIGRVTLCAQDAAYKGGRFLMVQPLNREQLAKTAGLLPLAKASSLVVYDNLGAGRGDVIAFSEGAEATAPFENPIPIDAYCCALIDRIHYKPNDI
ncbi:EutN/CcmL family microcompartment protein [Pelagicoccus sp. SDUM812003]|uniref:EutN/CcmL family microcompartment protein n=1 Tax=Pelagicoccus sp. SDUM812003 TaxID=3041267 RepID=UPI00280EB6C4|nr:EutN/CcmL family microcompartment protein [Pelagicoccus sp. SDUM812003]MDQ8204639.1 EutN/CcmL family microcompartment protein [Pelagicoccus sp. SDUM812003]